MFESILTNIDLINKTQKLLCESIIEVQNSVCVLNKEILELKKRIPDNKINTLFVN